MRMSKIKFVLLTFNVNVARYKGCISKYGVHTIIIVNINVKEKANFKQRPDRKDIQLSRITLMA